MKTLKPQQLLGWKRQMNQGGRKSHNNDGMDVRHVSRKQPHGMEESLGQRKEAQYAVEMPKILRNMLRKEIK